MSFGDSILQTASIARWVSVAVHDYRSHHRSIRQRKPRGSVSSEAARRCTTARYFTSFWISGGKSDISCTCRTSITSLSPAGQRDAHSTASSFDFTWIIQ